jgi:hypothetical protein
MVRCPVKLGDDFTEIYLLFFVALDCVLEECALFLKLEF